MAQAQWTHLALHVRDTEASVDFCAGFTSLRTIEQHSDADSTGLNVLWSSREAVDDVAARARQIEALRFRPVFVNEHAGYLCVLADPDGHHVGFSHRQVLGPSPGA